MFLFIVSFLLKRKKLINCVEIEMKMKLIDILLYINKKISTYIYNKNVQSSIVNIYIVKNT